MQTDRFNHLRKDILTKVFDKHQIVKIWRNIVKNQLRSVDILDIYDYYDFNYNIENRAEVLRKRILDGTYKVEQPLYYRIEKKFGICRLLIIPHPSDALIMQVIVEYIGDSILQNQPSKKAFFSRDRHNIPKPHDFSNEYDHSWRKQWKSLQKEIYNFSDTKELIVVTDLSNFYDSIDINELRKVITSHSKIDEVLIDLVFRIISDLSWKPDYLPYSDRGLPTSNIEGIRLLAHSFLFEIDKVLADKTKDCFTRWMDDIVFGVDSRKEAIETINSISEMLRSRGLALNLSKTNIFERENGIYNFQINENKQLDAIENNVDLFKDYDKKLEEEHLVYDLFSKTISKKEVKSWDKVAKRCITVLSKMNSKILLSDLCENYINIPSLRLNYIYYLEKYGFSIESSNVVLDILDTIYVFDDISSFQLCNLITKWEVPIDMESKKFLTDAENKLTKISFSSKKPMNFYSVLWFKSKYNDSDQIVKFLNNKENIWKSNSFLQRQVTAILSRLLKTNEVIANKILKSQISSGIISCVSLANAIDIFRNIEKLDTKLNSYLFPTSIQKPYPLSKFLILCSVLNSEKIRNNNEKKKKIKKSITDPYYLKWLDAQYNIN